MAKPSSLTLLTLFTLLATFFSSGFADNILYTNEILSDGASLTYAGYRLTMQSDCNLVLYDNNRAIWSSDTYNCASGCYLKMQSDGNLVIYSNNGVVWASGTNVGNGNGNYILVPQRRHLWELCLGLCNERIRRWSYD
ncbi:hypothetical protein QJS10_CPA03g01748 [Acorus calamus]|uniref:Bulb-type lectin domain-containing protein n=1 Tax=Acorus calamus TaxID=4465 RepID=A0AAV9F560_ACOCL|nr:hypothetical protein QJS10_CPA03g01748 [Acorus calamus]